MQNLNLMFNLIASTLFNKELNKYWKDGSYDINYLKDIYNLCKRHDLSHIIATKLVSLDISKKSNELYKEFLQKMLFTSIRYDNLKSERDNIAKILEDNKFKHIFLKGFSVIRSFYPEPWLRTCGDIDLLVKNQDMDKINDLLVNKFNYKINEEEKNARHHIAYFSPSGVAVEVHFKLNSELDSQIEDVLNNAWEGVTPVDGTNYQFELSPELTYFFHIAHMEKHFKHFDCGIRLFTDLYYFNHYYTKLDKTKILPLLEKTKLLTFTKVVSELADVWFDNKPHNDITLKMEKYCTNIEYNKELSRKKFIILERAKYGGKLNFIFRRCFLTYDELIVFYPELKGKKYLLPYYHVRRAMYYLSRGLFSLFIKDLKMNNEISKEESQDITQLVKDLHIFDNK